MRVLVTGATGFVGGHLARALAARGDEVHLLLRPGREGLPGCEAHHPPADGLPDLLAALRPEVTFHLASRFQDRHEAGEIDGILESNVTFPTRLADAMVRAGCHALVNAGTAWQHGAGDAPTCLYAASKSAFEAMLRFFAATTPLRAVTLTLFDTYGPGDSRPKLIPRFLTLRDGGEALAMSPGEQRIDLVHVDDVVRAFLMAGERVRTGGGGMEEYAVRSGAPVSLRELADLFGRLAGRPLPIEWGGRPYRPREVMTPWEGGATLPGWTPAIALERGLRRLLDAA